jgi:hypothetical protein
MVDPTRRAKACRRRRIAALDLLDSVGRGEPAPRVVTPRLLRRMKKDTVRPMRQDGRRSDPVPVRSRRGLTGVRTFRSIEEMVRTPERRDSETTPAFSPPSDVLRG